MTIVLPIVFFVVILGLTVRRVTPAVWLAVAAWIALIIAVSFGK